VAGTRPDHDIHSLDPAALRTLSDMVGGDREVLAELVDEVLEEAPRRLVEMRSSDAALAGRAAHTLKSNALTFGATELASACRDVELTAREGEVDAGLVDVAVGAWARVRPELIGLR
jgi:HPt (histidine-containing phosphotransfer) domain-containing protein